MGFAIFCSNIGVAIPIFTSIYMNAQFSGFSDDEKAVLLKNLQLLPNNPLEDLARQLEDLIQEVAVIEARLTALEELRKRQ